MKSQNLTLLMEGIASPCYRSWHFQWASFRIIPFPAYQPTHWYSEPDGSKDSLSNVDMVSLSDELLMHNLSNLQGNKFGFTLAIEYRSRCT